MPDPIAFQPQSTNQLPGDTSPDTYRVLIRGRERISTSDWTTAGSGFYAFKVVDFSQFKFSITPMVEVYYNDGDIYKAPMTIFSSSTGAVTAYCNVKINAGTKIGGLSNKITLQVWSTSASQIDLYYQLMSLPAGGSLFP